MIDALFVALGVFWLACAIIDLAVYGRTPWDWLR